MEVVQRLGRHRAVCRVSSKEGWLPCVHFPSCSWRRPNNQSLNWDFLGLACVEASSHNGKTTWVILLRLMCNKGLPRGCSYDAVNHFLRARKWRRARRQPGVAWTVPCVLPCLLSKLDGCFPTLVVTTLCSCSWLAQRRAKAWRGFAHLFAGRDVGTFLSHSGV